jgi:hypothetical protein
VLPIGDLGPRSAAFARTILEKSISMFEILPLMSSSASACESLPCVGAMSKVPTSSLLASLALRVSFAPTWLGLGLGLGSGLGLGLGLGLGFGLGSLRADRLAGRL